MHARWQWYGVELLLGAEINILDGKGNLDLDEDYMKMLDIRIAGIHSLCYEYGTIEENTHGMVQVISNPFIHIISHPGDGKLQQFIQIIVTGYIKRNMRVTSQNDRNFIFLA